MRGLLTEGRLLMAMLTTGTLAPAPGWLPMRAVTAPRAGPTRDGTSWSRARRRGRQA